MNIADSGEGCINVQRLRATYLVSSQHPSPEKVQARLDEAMRQDLGQILAAALAPWFSRHDTSIWFIRRLELAADVNAAWDREQVARSLARQIVRALSAALHEDAIDGENILRFPDRAAYLAHFLMDLAEGRAWTKWYYHPFNGLRLLPAPAAFHTAVCDDPATGLAALRQIPEPQLRRALQTLTRQGARAILEKIAGAGAAHDDFACLQQAWQAAENLGVDLCNAGTVWQNALWIFLRAGTALAATTLLAAMRALEHRPADWVNAALTTLRAQATGQAGPKTAAENERQFTRCGGIFLLLPLLDELPLAEALRDWPEFESHALAAVVRWLILVKCCGRENARQAFADPLLRDLLQVEASLTPPAMALWQKQITRQNIKTFLKAFRQWRSHRQLTKPREKRPDDLFFLAAPESLDLSRLVTAAITVAARDLLRAFAGRLPGFAKSGLPYLHANFLDFSATLEDEPERRVVRLGRPPLYVVLNMAGLSRATYRLSWLDDRPFALFQTE
jgi:hypothetical protein